MRELRFNVAGDTKDDIPMLAPDLPLGTPQIACVFEQPSRCLAIVPHGVYGGAWMSYQGGHQRFRVIVPPDADGQWEAGDPLCIPPEYGGDFEKVALHYRTIADLPALEIRGRYFWRNGERFFLNGATGFNAPSRFTYEGADALRPMLAQRQALGFTAIRLWSAYNIPLIGRLIPREHADFYDRIVPGCSALCAEYGQYPYWTGLTGPYSVTLGGTDQIIEHDLRMQDALSRVPYALYDRRNESTKDVNQVDESRLPALSLYMASQGSNQQDQDPPTPFGRFAARHPSGSEWQRKVGKQAFDSQNNLGRQEPWADDETVRCEPGGENNPRHAHDAGACGALFIASAFLHTAQAKLGIPWTDLYDGRPGELTMARSWCEGVASIVAQGLDIAQDGQYFNHGDNLPDIIRIYEKRLGARSITLEIGA